MSTFTFASKDQNIPPSMGEGYQKRQRNLRTHGKSIPCPLNPPLHVAYSALEQDVLALADRLVDGALHKVLTSAALVWLRCVKKTWKKRKQENCWLCYSVWCLILTPPIFFLDPVVLESIYYRTRAKRLLNESNTTLGLRKNWTGSFSFWQQAFFLLKNDWLLPLKLSICVSFCPVTVGIILNE